MRGNGKSYKKATWTSAFSVYACVWSFKLGNWKHINFFFVFRYEKRLVYGPSVVNRFERVKVQSNPIRSLPFGTIKIVRFKTILNLAIGIFTVIHPCWGQWRVEHRKKIYFWTVDVFGPGGAVFVNYRAVYDAPGQPPVLSGGDNNCRN